MSPCRKGTAGRAKPHQARGQRVRLAGPGDGMVLVFFALLSVAVFGLAALVIDLAIVRVTQSQMQAAADAAALEGALGRDLAPLDPTLSDLERRARAAAFAALLFDGDLDRGTLESDLLLGAGPTFETGVGGVANPAGGALLAGAPWVPQLAWNEAQNLSFGDLVAGDFQPLDPSAPGRSDWHVEAADYGRFDFSPAASGLAFLARLRRSPPSAPLDRIAGVSSAGPTVPFLFGLGSPLGASDPDTYDPRRDGLTVRATAVASALRATAASVAGPGRPGLAPVGLRAVGGGGAPQRCWISLEETLWAALPDGAPVTLTVAPDGSVLGTAAGALVHGATRGLARLGEPLIEGPVALPGGPAAEWSGLLYLGLHQRDGGGALRLRGFTALTGVSAAALPGPAFELRGQKRATLVAPANASAQPALAFDLSFAAAPLPGAAPLLAPALTR